MRMNERRKLRSKEEKWMKSERRKDREVIDKLKKKT